MKVLKFILETILALAVLALICWGVIYLVEHRAMPWQPSKPELVTEIDGVKLYKFKDNGNWIYFTNNGMAHRKEGK